MPDEEKVDSLVTALGMPNEETPADPKVADEGKPEDQKVSEEEKPADQKVAEEKKETLRNVMEKEPAVKIPKKTNSFPEVTDDDYKVLEDGKVEIKAQHILDDIEEIVNNDVSLFQKIYNKKNGGKKAEVIAKALGFSDDATRTASQVARDTFRAWSKAVKNGDDEKANEIYDSGFPEQLKEEGVENYQKAEDIKPSKAIEVEKPKDNSAELESSISSFVGKNIYKFVDSNFSQEDVSAKKQELVDKLVDSPTVFELVSKKKFDENTGKELTTEQKLEKFSDKIFEENKESLPKGGGAKAIKSQSKDSDGIEVDNLASIIGEGLKR